MDPAAQRLRGEGRETFPYAGFHGTRLVSRYGAAMGYFRRKLDRGKLRERKRRHERAFAENPPSYPAWQLVPPEPPPRKPTAYLRFSCAQKNPWSGRRMGIFTIAFRVRDDPELDDISRASLRDSLEWFNQNLPAPDDLREDAAIFLFRSAATECLARIWELVRMLGEHGVVCEMQKVRKPGRIVYRDRYQIAAVPPTRGSPL